MAFGQIYCTSWFGDDVNKQTVPQFATLNCGSEDYESFYSFNFDGIAPAEVIVQGTDIPFQPDPATGFTITGFIEPSQALGTGSYSQKCIVDMSSSISSTANGKGYSLYMRKTSSGNPKVCFFVKEPGATQSNCRVEVDLPTFTGSARTFVVFARLLPTGGGNVEQKIVISDTTGVLIGSDSLNKSLASIPYPTQDFCIGNTSQTNPSTSSEFNGKIDEITFSYDGWSNSDLIRLQSAYAISDNLNFNSYASAQNKMVVWYRMGENATQSGPNLTLLNASTQNPNTGTYNAVSQTLSIADRVGGIV